MPTAGGAIEEKTRIKLPDGVSMVGISYKGDIEGWRKRFIEICAASGRRYGFIKDGRLVMSTGEAPVLQDLEVTMTG